MATAETLRRREARHDERERATVTASEPAMASIRLRGAFDAAQRGPLSGPKLERLAERITAGTTTDADHDLLEAFDPDDLAAANLTPAAFVVARADIWRVFACHAAAPDETPDGDAIPCAAAAIRCATAALGTYLRAMPSEDDLEEVGARIIGGTCTPGDLALTRALPGAFLRSHATDAHWRVMVSYRDE